MAGKGSAKPGIQRLMRDAQHGEFSVLLAEALTANG
ncbi:DNA invertase Pin-like site-specific DNA recombinase [Rhizobium petrolearium]|nr:DNA invertase Pin-like site-specific DNA recombinase [Neorhizobium petrolearium]